VRQKSKKLKAWHLLLLLAGGAMAAPAAPRPNVVLITIDTLRADHLPAYGYRKLDTPAIDSLAKDGALFERALAHAPITLPSHTSILTGLYPITHGVRNNGDFYLRDEVPTLAQMLKQNGYQTAAFVSAFLLDSRFGLGKGFDVYDDSTTSRVSRARPDLVKERKAAETTAAAVRWLEANYPLGGAKAEPFFLWAHYFDPHLDYNPPEPYRSRYRSNLYDAEIAYADSQVGVLLDELKKLGRYRDTLLILTADHGESLGEHGEAAHSVFIYDATQRIPFIVKLPREAAAGARLKALARHVDIVPTVIDAANLRGLALSALHAMPGRSLLGVINGAAGEEGLSYAEAYLPKDYYGWAAPESVDDGRYKYIQLPRPEFYDLSRDPRERENLVSVDSERAARMQARLEALEKRYGTAQAQQSARGPDADLLTALRAAGYMGGLPISPAEAGKDPKDMIRVEETILSAQRAVGKEDFPGGARLLEGLLKESPENVSARAMLADIYRKTGHIDEAIREYGEVIKRSPLSLNARLALANIHIKDRSDFSAAGQEIAQAMVIAPTEPASWVLRGDLAQARGDLAMSMEFYRKAEEMGETSANMLVGLGSALNKLGRYAQAKEKLLSAIDTQPDDAEAHYNLGVVLENLGSPKEAEKEYRLAIVYNSKDNLSYGNLGSLYQKQGRLKEAEEVLLVALKIKENDLVALYDLGRVYMDTRRPDEAFPLFERASKLAQASAMVRAQCWYSMAQIRAGQGRKKEAQDCLAQALRVGSEKLRRQAEKDPLFAGWDLGEPAKQP